MSFNSKVEDEKLDQMLGDLKIELEYGNGLLEYFLEIGVDPSLAYEEWLYDNVSNFDMNKLQPKIISQFPPFNKKISQFDIDIVEHCFPKGYKLLQKQFLPPEVFSFVLDNNISSIVYTQKYVSCLIIYESIDNYFKLYKKKKEFEANELMQLEKLQSNELDLNCTVSTLSTRNSGNGQVEISIKNMNKEVFIPKCIMLISLYPFFGEMENILTKIYEYTLCGQLNMTIDKIIQNLVIEVPTPPRGIYTVEYILIKENRKIKQKLMNELPIIDFDLRVIFKHFSIEDVIDIYRFLILEFRMLFFTRDITLLNSFLYGMLSMLFPLKYSFQIVTILPKKRYDTIGSLTPFLFGINETYRETFFEDNEIEISENLIIVDIDNSAIILQESINNFEDSDDKEDISQLKLPPAARAGLQKNLSNIISFNKIKRTMVSNERTYILVNNDFNSSIQAAFFNFNVELLQNYQKYLNFDFFCTTKSPQVASLFKVNEFINDLKTSEIPFYTKFIKETQMFIDFLYKKMIPKTNRDKLEILLFDEKINDLSKGLFSKSKAKIFTNAKDYTYKTTMKINGPRELNEKEIDFFQQTINQRTLFNYGVIVSHKNEENISLSYPIFPKLMTEIFFKDYIKDYFFPLKVREEIETIDSYIIAKSHLGQLQVHQSGMENYILLCWLQLWAVSFWYCDEQEKKYRFWRLLQILKLVTHHEIDVFNLLFEVLEKYGSDYMLIKLYDLILSFGLNPSFQIRDKITRLLDKKSYRSINHNNITEKLKDPHIVDVIKDDAAFNISKFRRRTFKTKDNANIINDTITFFPMFTCLCCQKIIYLEEISKRYEDMQRGLLWAKCPYCKNMFVPKITIKIGDDLNKTIHLCFPTSVVVSSMLFSTLFLKTNLEKAVLKECGIKLDIEDFRNRYSAVFWNAIWYFKMKNLEYDFLLPYEHTLSRKSMQKFNSHISLISKYVVDVENMRKKGKNNLSIKKTNTITIKAKYNK